ncbi:MAG: FAD-dependent oxidoreductase, partial [Kiritimatiellae bacterium]|nr:FAD-dependent oxidoreductase [Kiritimatiellia bacterium]
SSDLCDGKGEEGDIERPVELSERIKETALCGLGKTAPNPVLSTIRHFREEYVAHIRDKHCPAGVCPNLVRAPCQSACPAGVDVPGFVALVGEKRYAEALRLHRERNPFAAACARVCFHYCEDHCRRATLDAPVSIRGVKRFMVDQEVTVQVPDVWENEENAKRKVAVIGAGPAGLSCAYFLARLGYKPVVYEAEQRPGGMMTQAIPAYRLPREILAREVRMMERIGVQIETGKRLGSDLHLQELKDQGCEAVFFGVGAPDCTKLGIPGEELEGVTGALEFLRHYNTRGSVPVGHHVVVCGGGNAAVDAARTAIRLDAESVTIIYRRTREEMPAYAEEIEEAENEGVKLMMLTSPVKMIGKDGKLTAIRCKRMKLGDYDRSGRRRPEASDEEEVLIPCEQVISAVGQELNAKGMLDGVELNLSEKGFIRVDPVTQRTSTDWIFAGGDAVRGPASVIEAVADGERAAIGIDWMLTGERHDFWREQKPLDVEFDPDADPSDTPRQKLPLISVERRRNNFDEVEQPWDEATAIRQATRCLRCDYGKQPCAR